MDLDPIQVKVIGQGKKLFVSATRISVINTCTKFHCNPSSSFSETVPESWQNNNNNNNNNNNKKRGERRNFVTSIRHDGAT